MSDKSAQTKKKLAQNADKITIAVLVLILAGLGYVWWQEQSSTLGEASAQGRPANLQDTIAGSPALKMLQNMSDSPTLSQDPGVQRVAQLNMFDFSTIQAESALEAQALKKVEQAKTLIDQGKTEEARPLLEEARDVMGYNAQVFELLDKITTKSETMTPGNNSGTPF